MRKKCAFYTGRYGTQIGFYFFLGDGGGGGDSVHRGPALGGGGQKVLVAYSLITINVVNTMKFREYVQLLNLKKKYSLCM